MPRADARHRPSLPIDPIDPLDPIDESPGGEPAGPAPGRRADARPARRARKPTPDRLVEELLGHRSLRPGQRDAIAGVLAGRDVVSVMATGSGKSAIYQVCGAVLDGPTVVVSPLIALQQDQLATLHEGGLEEQVGRAAALNSTMAAGERADVLARFAAGDVEFLFVAPEQLRNADTLESLAAAEPSLVVVDEAHCVSAWGHDFRPAYGELGAALDALGRPVVLCLTATASPPVRDDIVRTLGLDDPLVVVAGFDRPNIHLSVRRFTDADERDNAVVAAAVELHGDGIVYVATRRRAEELAARIAADRPADHYHGARRRAERDEAQERFVAGDVEVMVATNAFGMGIDKPDVRWVLHADVPDSLDSYQQELGRAGRDGAPARAVLFHRHEDVGRRRFLSGVARRRPSATADGDADGERAPRRDPEHGAGDREQPDSERPHDDQHDNDQHDNDQHDNDQHDNDQHDGEQHDGEQHDGEQHDGEQHDETEEQAARRAAWLETRLEMMRTYAETDVCRRQQLLTSLGEPFSGPCEACDVCDAARDRHGIATSADGVTADADADAPPGGGLPWSVPGTPVVHATWGRGQVLSLAGDRLTVLFDDAGYRNLSAGLVADEGLLSLAE